MNDNIATWPKKRGRPLKARPTHGVPPLPDAGRPEWGIPIYGHQLAIGDTLVHLGRTHLIDRFERYNGSLRGVLGDGTRTAYSGTWGITVGPYAIKRILPRPGGDDR